MREEWCDHHNRNVTLMDCVKCSLMCAYRPWLHEAGLWSATIVQRWGVAEIERYLADRADEIDKKEEED